jgi:hypothetical protein
MRILKALLSFLLTLTIIGVVVVFATREILLIVAAHQVKSDFTTLVKKVSLGDYAGECTRLGTFGETGLAQLRFISRREYVTEVTCGVNQLNPVLVEKRTLPLLAMKELSDAGFVSSDSEAEVVISVMGRSVLLTKSSVGEVSWSYGTVPDEHVVTGPVTNCSGYGLTCCQDTQEQGYGRGIQGASDCPKSCFDGCWSRPVVLAFNSEPFYDLASRIVTIPSGQEVRFSYVLSETQEDAFADTGLEEQKDPTSVLLAVVEQWFGKRSEGNVALQQAEIDFGDGKQQDIPDLQGEASHVYTCAQTSCTFVATLTGTNRQGVQTQSNVSTTITIVVKP